MAIGGSWYFSISSALRQSAGIESQAYISARMCWWTRKGTPETGSVFQSRGAGLRRFRIFFLLREA